VLFFRTVPPANTLVRWVNENAFAFIVQARPCPTFGRPVHLGDGPHRLQPGTSPHALRIPPYDGHPALRSTASSGSRSVLAVSGFHFRARLDVSIPSASPASEAITPHFWIWRPSLERQRDLNPPEQRTAQHTLLDCRPSGSHRVVCALNPELTRPDQDDPHPSES
jgi:hypothetical protein